MWIAERVGKRDRPESLGQPEGRGDHRFGAVRCPDSRCVSFRGNHQPGPVAGSGPGRGNAAGVLPRHSGSRCRGMRLHIGSANRRKAAPRTGAEWSIAVVHMAVAVGQILRPGEAGRFLRRWQRRHAAVQVGCSTNDRHGSSRRRGRAGGSMAEVVDPSILLADYQAKVERLIPASERGPGLTFLMLLLPVTN
jgi:hypothetical protein